MQLARTILYSSSLVTAALEASTLSDRLAAFFLPLSPSCMRVNNVSNCSIVEQQHQLELKGCALIRRQNFQPHLVAIVSPPLDSNAEKHAGQEPAGGLHLTVQESMAWRRHRGERQKQVFDEVAGVMHHPWAFPKHADMRPPHEET